MKFYSYAGQNAGRSSPNHVHCVWVDSDGEKSLAGDMMVLVWSGNGYSRRNSWISAVEGDVVDLEDNR